MANAKFPHTVVEPSIPPPGKAPAVNLSLPPDPERHRQQLQAVMDVAWAVSSTMHIDALLPLIMDRVQETIKAERSTFYVVDPNTGELWSKVLHGEQPKEIRLPKASGIAGWVADNAQAVNLPDAYEDPRFDRSWDDASGFRTRSLMCVPILNKDREVIAVIQCLNKQGRQAFDREDEELLGCIGGQCAVAIETAFLHDALLERNAALERAEQRLVRANRELELLYELEQQLSQAEDLDELLAGALERICGQLKSEGAAILLQREDAGEVQVCRVGRPALERHALSLEQTRQVLAHTQGPVARKAETIGGMVDLIVPDVAGLRAKDSLTAPLLDGRAAIGALQVVNRASDADGEESALRLLSLLAGQVARAIVVRRQRESAERAGRLALLGHSVGAILHDMKTPMTAVGGYAELMALEEQAEVRQDYVERIGRALAHIEGMTQEVLSFARGQREILTQRVYTDRFVDEVREMLAPEMEHFGVELVVRDRYDGVARFDAGKIKRVLFNLARNACQAMGEGGRFTWTIERQGDNLIFECADDGPGIPRAMEGRLFESFATHGKSEGTGLGLAMAKKIVDAHCGRIECRSEPGRGATFRIELPM